MCYLSQPIFKKAKMKNSTKQLAFLNFIRRSLLIVLISFSKISAYSQEILLNEIIPFQTSNKESANNQKFKILKGSFFFLDYSYKEGFSKDEWFLKHMSLTGKVDSIPLKELKAKNLTEIFDIDINDYYLVILMEKELIIYDRKNNFKVLANKRIADLGVGSFSDCHLSNEKIYLSRNFRLLRTDDPGCKIFNFNIKDEKLKLVNSSNEFKISAVESINIDRSLKLVDFNENGKLVIGDPISGIVNLLDHKFRIQNSVKIFSESREQKIEQLGNAFLRFSINDGSLDTVLKRQGEINSLNRIFLDSDHLYVFYEIFDSLNASKNMVYKILRVGDKSIDLIGNEKVQFDKEANTLTYQNFPLWFWYSYPMDIKDNLIVVLSQRIEPETMGMDYEKGMKKITDYYSFLKKPQKRSFLIYKLNAVSGQN